MPASDTKRVVKIRPPLKGVRRISGTLAMAAGSLMLIPVHAGSFLSLSGWIHLILSAGLLISGIGLAFLEKIVIPDRQTSQLFIEWTLGGFAVLHRKKYQMSEADRVVIAQRQEPFVQSAETVFVADRSFPVLLCAGNTILVTVIGMNMADQAPNRFWQISLPTSAFFHSYARYVGAHLATELCLPLEDRSSDTIYSPDQIPGDWLDPGQISARLTWRRLHGRL